ncbi:MAG: HlyC/CorC family transporter, partial [Clostridia bacterium]|nr:HlyC/CorC family transporter [Clostridia bacterium]
LHTLNSDGMASFVSTVVMTVIILIFGEIVPKIVAKNNADSAVRIFAWPTRILTWILYPLVWLVMKLIRFLSSLWGKDDEDAPTVTEEELSSIIETAEEEGVMDEEKSELLQSAIDFRDTTVEEIMTPRIDMTAFDIADTPEEIAALVGESRYSRIPVYEDSIDNIIGILYLNHYYKRITDREAGSEFSLRDLLMKPSFIHKTMKLPAALSLLRERKTHIAIVVDEFGGTLGLVTMEDILEELVGEIWDESDEIVEECVRTGENTYEVNGDMNIDDFFAEIGFEPRDFECEYSTVGGWAIERLEADPHVGDSFSFRDIPLEDGEEPDGDEPVTTLTVVVSAMDDMRVTKLTVLVSKSAAEDGEKEE